MIITMMFGFFWGFVTAYLGIGWFDGDLFVAAIANVLPILAVAVAEHR